MEIEATYIAPKDGRELKILGRAKLLRVTELGTGKELEFRERSKPCDFEFLRSGHYIGPMDWHDETIRLGLELEDSESLEGLFFWCLSLAAIDYLDLGGLLPNSVKAMFAGCLSLESVPSFDTWKVTDFSAMFLDCLSLNEAPKLNTSKGKDFSAMFSGCSRLESVPAMETANGENFNSMFAYCSRLKEAPALDTGKGKIAAFMFRNCQALEHVPELDLRGCSDYSEMF